LSKAVETARYSLSSLLILSSDRFDFFDEPFGSELGEPRRGKTDKARIMNIAESSLEESRYYT
jgi:hypothetical protein